MLYASEFIGKPVVDADGKRIGKLKDLIAARLGEVPHPLLVAIEVKQRSGSLFIPMDDVAALISIAIPLKKKISDITPYEPTGEDLHLVRDVLDKQIIDTDGMRGARQRPGAHPCQWQCLRRQRRYKRRRPCPPAGLRQPG